MELIILMGLQASGKSTFFRMHFSQSHSYVSKDLLRNNRRPAQRQHQLIEEALQAGQSVVVDNTNVTVQARADLISLGQAYGAEVIGYYFEVQVGKSLERNKQRIGKQCVPDIAIFATLKALVPPNYNEGFAQLHYVCSNDNFTFALSDWVERSDC